MRHHPRPHGYTLDQICYNILRADRPDAKVVRKTVPAYSRTRTRTSTLTLPTPIVTAETSTISTVTVTEQTTEIGTQKRRQRVDFSRLQSQCRSYRREVLNQVSSRFLSLTTRAWC